MEPTYQSITTAWQLPSQASRFAHLYGVIAVFAKEFLGIYKTLLTLLSLQKRSRHIPCLMSMVWGQKSRVRFEPQRKAGCSPFQTPKFSLDTLIDRRCLSPFPSSSSNNCIAPKHGNNTAGRSPRFGLQVQFSP